MKTNHIISLIGRIRDKANKFIVNELQRNNIKGIAPTHGDILVALFRHDSVAMKELATFINRDKSTITALVDKLVKYGYVRKQKDLEDSRVTIVSLTEEGEALRPIFFAISEKLINQVYAPLSQGEQKAVITLLSKIERGI